MNEQTYTIIGNNSNYVEEVPAFETEQTQEEIDSYIQMADETIRHEDGSITISFLFDDGTEPETYTITKNN